MKIVKINDRYHIERHGLYYFRNYARPESAQAVIDSDPDQNHFKWLDGSTPCPVEALKMTDIECLRSVFMKYEGVLTNRNTLVVPNNKGQSVTWHFDNEGMLTE